MIITIFHSLLFIFISYSHGILFLKKLLKTKIDYNFFEICLIGLLVTLTILPLVNFFIPLNNLFLILNLLLLTVYFIFNKKIFYKSLKFDYRIFIFVFFLVQVNIYGSGFSDDLDHYHYSSITNSDEMNIIWGNSFLHPLYGTSSIWLTGHSYFNFDFTRLIDIHVLNGLILFLIISLFLSEIDFSKKKNFFFNKFLFLILMFVVVKYTRIKEFGIDRPAIILFCFLIYYYFKFYLININKNYIDKFVIFFLISLTIVSIKITYLPVLIIPFFVFLLERKHYHKISYKYLLILLPVFVFIFKNIFSSGCLVFPLEITCLKFLSWSNHLGSIEFSSYNEAFNKSWTSYKGTLNQFDYIKDFNWFNTWFDRGKVEILEYFLTISFIIFLSYFLVVDKFKSPKKIHHKLRLFKVSLLLMIVLSLILYFLKNPVLRMNHHVLISIMIIFSFFSLFTKIKIKASTLASYFFILAFLFNFYKNFERINHTKFENNPETIISKKKTEAKEEKIGNFVYYVGWYGQAPIGIKTLENKKYKRKLIFNIIYNDK